MDEPHTVAELVLKATDAFRLRRPGNDPAFRAVKLQGILQCKELRIGDGVLAVSGNCVWRGVIEEIESLEYALYLNLPAAGRGECVAVTILGRGEYELRRGTALYLVATADRSSPVATQEE